MIKRLTLLPLLLILCGFKIQVETPEDNQLPLLINAYWTCGDFHNGSGCGNKEFILNSRGLDNIYIKPSLSTLKKGWLGLNIIDEHFSIYHPHYKFETSNENARVKYNFKQLSTEEPTSNLRLMCEIIKHVDDIDTYITHFSKSKKELPELSLFLIKLRNFALRLADF